MFASRVTDLAFGLTLLAAGLSFGWYLSRAFRRAPLPFLLHRSIAGDLVTVLVMALVALGVVLLADATIWALHV